MANASIPIGFPSKPPQKEYLCTTEYTYGLGVEEKPMLGGILVVYLILWAWEDMCMGVSSFRRTRRRKERKKQKHVFFLVVSLQNKPKRGTLKKRHTYNIYKRPFASQMALIIALLGFGSLLRPNFPQHIGFISQFPRLSFRPTSASSMAIVLACPTWAGKNVANPCFNQDNSWRILWTTLGPVDNPQVQFEGLEAV